MSARNWSISLAVIGVVLWVAFLSRREGNDDSTTGSLRDSGQETGVSEPDDPGESPNELDNPDGSSSSLSQEEADSVQPARESTVFEARVWPVGPDEMKSLILAELARSNLGQYTVSYSDCTPTACEIRIVAGSLAGLAGPDSTFPNLITGPPYDAAFKLEARRQPTGDNEVTFTFSANPLPPPTSEEVEQRMRRDASVTRGIAANALPPSSFGAPPVVFGRRDGAEEVVEDVCSVDCPNDGQRMIYLIVPDGRRCADFDGIEQTVNVRSSTGSFSERTFCVQRFLLDF